MMLSQNDPIIQSLTGASSGLSVVGSLGIIVTSLALRRYGRHFFALKLLLFISVADFCAALNFFLSVVGNLTHRWGSDEDDAGCIVQAVIMQYFDVCSFLWMACFSHSIWYEVRNKTRRMSSERRSNQRRELWYHAICWLLPIVPLLVLTSLDMFGPAGPWCWISNRESMGRMFRFLFYYIPLWTIMLATVIVYIVVMVKSQDKLIVKRVSVFILVFVITYVPATFNRIQNWIAGGDEEREWYWLHCLQAVCSPMQGFLNAIVYGFTLPVVRTHLREVLAFGSPFTPKSSSDSNHEEDLQRAKQLSKDLFGST